MAYSRYEFAGKGVTLTKKTASDANKAQNAFIEYWNGRISKAELTTKLSGLAASAIEFVYRRSAYSAIPGFIASTLSGADAYEKKKVLEVAQKGENELDKVMNLFLDNDNYASITFNATYLGFKNLATGNTDYTIIASNIVPIKIMTTGGGSILL